MSRIITGTFTNGVLLSTPTDSPVTVANGALIESNGFALVGGSLKGQPDYNFPWIIKNLGFVEGKGINTTGIVLYGGGTINNYNYISGARQGIYAYYQPATVTNKGSISAYGTAGTGVFLSQGGRVSNYGTILGTVGGVEIKGANATVANSGTIKNRASAPFGVSLSGFTSNSVGNSGYIGSGVVETGARGTLTNTGTIAGSVSLGGGGIITNGVTGSTAAQINGFSTAIAGTGTIINYGTISGFFDGVNLPTGGTLSNAQPGAVITTGASGQDGIFLGGSARGTITNLGTVKVNGSVGAAVNLADGGGTFTNGSASVTSAFAGFGSSSSGDGFYSSPAATITNFATISAAEGMFLRYGGSVANTGTAASIYGHYSGIFGGAGTTINNTGTVAAVFSDGINLTSGGIVNGSAAATSALIVADKTDLATASIPALGTPIGIAIVTSGSVTNYGSIEGAHAGVYIKNTGIVVNGPSGATAALIEGVYAGIQTPNAYTGSATVTNFGRIAGIGTAGIGVDFAAADATLINAGTVSGAGGIAVSLLGGTDTLVVEPNSVLNGAVGNFGPGDTIDFAGKAGTSVSFSYGVLSLMQGGAAVASVDLSGIHAAGEFAVTPDGSGGTDIRFSATSTEAQLTTTSDFNGDGMSDVLWQNDDAQDSGSGQTSVWLMDGITPTATPIIAAVPPSWHVVGTGDFYGTGDADILWQNDNGQAAIWEMNGTTPTAEAVFASPPAAWHTVTTGDFNGDGMSDVVWQYENAGNSSDSQNGNVAIWEMNGTTTTAAAVVAVPGPNWDVVGTGDFNGDGKSDILWQYENSQNPNDSQNGNVAIWEMNGLTPIAAAVVAVPGPDWHAVGTGDFNGDGMADILWQYENGQNAGDPQNGTTAIWLMNGTTPTATAVIAEPGAAWHAVGTGDYDGNGKSDILWQNTDGQAAIWEMNGLTPTAASVFASPPSSWHVIPA